MQKVGQLIRQQRKNNNLSQAELSEGICSRSYLSYIESGKRLPPPSSLAKIADRLGLCITELMDDYLEEAALSPMDYIDLSRELTQREHFHLASEILETCRNLLQDDFTDYQMQYRLKRDYTESLGYWHFRQENYEEALHFYEQYLDFCQRRPANRFHLARAHFVVGNTKIRMHSYRESKSSLMLSFGHVINLDPDHAAVKKQRAVELHEKVVQALLYVLQRMKQYSVAKRFYEVAEMRWREMGILDRPHASIVNNAGLSLLGAGDIDEAKLLFERLNARELQPPYDRLCVHNLGLIHRLKGNLHRALGYLLEAWELFQDHGGWGGRALINEIVRCYLQLGSYDEAEKWLSTVEDLEDHHPLEPDPDSVAQTLILRQKLRRQDAKSDSPFLKEAEELDLSESALCGVLYERLRDLVEKEGPAEDIYTAINRLEVMLPGVFLQ